MLKADVGGRAAMKGEERRATGTGGTHELIAQLSLEEAGSPTSPKEAERAHRSPGGGPRFMRAPGELLSAGELSRELTLRFTNGISEALFNESILAELADYPPDKVAGRCVELQKEYLEHCGIESGFGCKALALTPKKCVLWSSHAPYPLHTLWPTLHMPSRESHAGCGQVATYPLATLPAHTAKPLYSAHRLLTPSCTILLPAQMPTLRLPIHRVSMCGPVVDFATMPK